jgi:hypothetical protein
VETYGDGATEHSRSNFECPTGSSDAKISASTGKNEVQDPIAGSVASDVEEAVGYQP